jgi:hypothetical protein
VVLGSEPVLVVVAEEGHLLLDFAGGPDGSSR